MNFQQSTQKKKYGVQLASSYQRPQCKKILKSISVLCRHMKKQQKKNKTKAIITKIVKKKIEITFVWLGSLTSLGKFLILYMI